MIKLSYIAVLFALSSPLANAGVISCSERMKDAEWQLFLGCIGSECKTERDKAACAESCCESTCNKIHGNTRAGTDCKARCQKECVSIFTATDSATD